MQLKEQDGKRVYSDGTDFEEEMLRIAKEYPGDAASEYICDDYDFAINITFSPVRHNLLNWYPFKENANILEVGAGMGSMTGLLCDVGDKVTALEESSSRADVIRARHKERKNLNIISADVTTWQTPERFDYVVLVGVMEYAGAFGKGNGNDTFIAFLQSLGRLLKPKGVLLLAIENRFGLKYWVGGSEDHLLEPFVGIAGYPDSDSPKTFSKSELDGLFSSAGFNARRFYYVLPDYKFPTGVFTDEALPTASEITDMNLGYSPNSKLIADERKLYPTILSDGIFDKFANSYLVEASLDTLPEEHVVRANGRGEFVAKYRIVSYMDNTGWAFKKACSKEAVEHVRQTHENSLALAARGVKVLSEEYESGIIKSPVCKASSAGTVFTDALNCGDLDLCKEMLDKLVASVKKSSELSSREEFVRKYGEMNFDVGPILKDGYMDLNLFNAFWEDRELVFFDQEWRFDHLPLRFILYYGLDILYGRNKANALIPQEELFRHLGIDQAESRLYDELRNGLWQHLFRRTGDVYGGDGNCNRYSEELTLTYQINQQHALYAKAETEIDDRNAHIRKLDAHIEELDGAVRHYQGEVQDYASKLAERDKDIQRMESDIVALEEKANALQGEVTAYEARKSQIAYQINQLEHHLHNANDDKAQVENELNLIKNSITWKTQQGIDRFLRLILGWPFRIYNRHRAKVLQETTHEGSMGLIQFDKKCPAITVPGFDTPQVSIIIPVYNEFAFTYRCIESIINTTEGVPYEVILADDNSSDYTKNAGKWIKGINIVRNKENLRFLRNCNNAAKQAKGKYIVFLNNDTLVRYNWLKSLVDIAEKDGTIGLCGSKILYPDGRLQEAGGILWKDGSAWNYGNGQDPEASEFNYVKEVDYISGCSIMTRKDLWNEIGGFDERFVPAYCEDSDYAFEVRKRGYKVVYQPLSCVVHFEGVSNGTDLSSGQKHYQTVNQAKFLEKWKDELNKDHFPNAQHVLRARDRSKNKKVMVMVDHYVPTFDKDAGSRTLYEYILLFLKNNYQITLIPDNFYRSEYTEIYQQLGVEVLYGPYYHMHYEDWLKNNAEDFDLFFLNRPHIAPRYIDVVRNHTNAKILYYGMDLHFLREQRQYEVTKDPQLLESIEKWKKAEFDLIHKSDCALFPSYVEEKVIREIEPDARVMVLPAFVYQKIDRVEYKIDGRKDLMFIGGFDHVPNRDAMVWFVNDILPKVVQQLPDIQLHILGSNPTEEIQALAGPNVQVHGYVTAEELNAYYKKSRISVVPLRYGAGIKGKVVEAMGLGMPVITTSIGAEGILGADKCLAIREEADTFADGICALYGDEELLSDMCSKAYDCIEASFGEKTAWGAVEKAESYTHQFDKVTDK